MEFTYTRFKKILILFHIDEIMNGAFFKVESLIGLEQKKGLFSFHNTVISFEHVAYMPKETWPRWLSR